MTSYVKDIFFDTCLLCIRIYCDLCSLLFTLFIRFPIAVLTAISELISGPRQRPKQFRSIVITGASVGIGAALAVEFAMPGVNIWITATKVENCDATKEACERKGARCFPRAVDIRNSSAMVQLLKEAHELCPLDLVIANAGCTPKVDGILEAAFVLETNAVGTANTIMPAAEFMLQAKKKGSVEYEPQLVLMSSLGGYASSGSLFISAYVASKNAIRTLGESLRIALTPNVGVTVILPGMTESRMVSTQVSQGINMATGIWPIEKATKLMASGIRQNKAEIAYPFIWFALSRVYGAVPPWIKDLVGPITRSFGDPYVKLDKVIWNRLNKQAERSM